MTVRYKLRGLIFKRHGVWSLPLLSMFVFPPGVPQHVSQKWLSALLNINTTSLILTAVASGTFLKKFNPPIRPSPAAQQRRK